MKFAFRQFPVRESQAFPGKKSVLRPVIPVTLIHPQHEENKITLHCAIDSGSDYCMFPTNIAPTLNLYRVETGPKWVWANTEDSSLVAYAHMITLQLNGYRWETRVLFSHELNPAPYGILGLEGFFDHFNVQIDFKNQNIEVIPNT